MTRCDATTTSPRPGASPAHMGLAAAVVVLVVAGPAGPDGVHGHPQGPLQTNGAPLQRMPCTLTTVLAHQYS